jgi:hypothetical protein
VNVSWVWKNRPALSFTLWNFFSIIMGQLESMNVVAIRDPLLYPLIDLLSG